MAMFDLLIPMSVFILDMCNRPSFLQRQSLLSRKLLANVLAAQNQAASAVEEYQKILATPSDDATKDDGGSRNIFLLCILQ